MLRFGRPLRPTPHGEIACYVVLCFVPVFPGVDSFCERGFTAQPTCDRHSTPVRLVPAAKLACGMKLRM